MVQAQIDSTTTTLTLGKMQERYEAASQQPERPNLITCTETLFNSYWSLLQPQQRFSDTDMAQAGWKNLLFNGAPVLEDSFVPASHMIFHNVKHIKLYSHNERKFPGKFIDFEEFFDQDAMIAKILWMGEMVCDSPRLQAAMTALTS